MVVLRARIGGALRGWFNTGKKELSLDRKRRLLEMRVGWMFGTMEQENKKVEVAKERPTATTHNPPQLARAQLTLALDWLEPRIGFASCSASVAR